MMCRSPARDAEQTRLSVLPPRPSKPLQGGTPSPAAPVTVEATSSKRTPSLAELSEPLAVQPITSLPPIRRKLTPRSAPWGAVVAARESTPSVLPPFPAVAGTSCRHCRPQQLWVLPTAATATSVRGHSRSVQRPLPLPSPAAIVAVYSDHRSPSWRLALPLLLVSSAAASSGVQFRRLRRLLSPPP
ncbi:predicted GPI-anchored protein 58 [Zingiber officinale]|uniref:predicted GPI-anchored protein 58 n=1 Tax=Zingiber officinale TaxID=94328 RepID=UPI001C4BFA36|nr:predicted GPI-anchored protein 58 [Zingiber officinale]